MSKHSVLTSDEFAKFVPPKRTLHFVEEYRQRNGLEPSQMNVLDWGCGRGRATLWFLERGYNSYGIDLDPETIKNGRVLLEQKGFDPSNLTVLSPEGLSDFPTDFFHFTYSNQVFEHVRDLDGVARELWRVTARRGEGHHIFPAHKEIVEGHLFMPFVHWLPKNKWRRRLISLCVRMGCEPSWPRLEGLSASEKASAYYSYSVNKTFYRRPPEIKTVFEQIGFRAWFETINHPRVMNHPILGPMTRSQATRSLLENFLVSFVSVEFHLQKS